MFLLNELLFALTRDILSALLLADGQRAPVGHDEVRA